MLKCLILVTSASYKVDSDDNPVSNMTSRAQVKQENYFLLTVSHRYISNCNETLTTTWSAKIWLHKLRCDSQKMRGIIFKSSCHSFFIQCTLACNILVVLFGQNNFCL